MLAQRCSPVAVPGSFLADGAASSSADRDHSLRSLDSATGGAPIAPYRRTGDRVWCIRQRGLWRDLLDHNPILTKLHPEKISPGVMLCLQEDILKNK